MLKDPMPPSFFSVFTLHEHLSGNLFCFSSDQSLRLSGEAHPPVHMLLFDMLAFTDQLPELAVEKSVKAFHLVKSIIFAFFPTPPELRL